MTGSIIELVDPDKKIDTKIIKLAEEYAECDRDSKDLSDRRKEIRDRIEEMGIHPLAWQHAIGMVKRMTPGERRDYQTSYQRVIGVIGDKQMSLFPENNERLRKREERAAGTPEAKKAAADAKTDTDPRSDPGKGGAAATVAADAAKAKEAAAWAASAPKSTRTPADDAQEQAEGAAALVAAAAAGKAAGAAAVEKKPPASGSKTDPIKTDKASDALAKAEATSKKRSQSEVAKDKLAAAGMN